MRKQNSLLRDFMAHFIANCITSVDCRIRQAADETDIPSKQANLPVSTIGFCCAMRCFIMLLNKLKPAAIRAAGGGCEVLLADTRRFHYTCHFNTLSSLCNQSNDCTSHNFFFGSRERKDSCIIPCTCRYLKLWLSQELDL